VFKWIKKRYAVPQRMLKSNVFMFVMFFLMHVINPFTQNNLIFLSPFSKKGEAQEVLSSMQKNLTFLFPVADLIENTVRYAVYSALFLTYVLPMSVEMVCHHCDTLLLSQSTSRWR